MSNDDLTAIRHSLAHLLGAAILDLWPKAKLAIGPAIDDGFYYDIDLSEPIGEVDLPKIEVKMRALAKDWTSFESKVIDASDAKKLFKTNPYKLELIEEIAAKDEPITIYTSGPPAGDFTDLCRGGHVENFQTVPMDAWKLDRLAGAYWRGDEKNKMLTRIYGLAFTTKVELEAHAKQLTEAKQRDHKKLGRELDLFTFSDLVGSGLPLWTPKGTLVRDLLDNFVWELRQAEGYARVDIPHLTKKDLYVTSGHWDKFKNELFHIKTREGHELVVKPMNCPHHTQIYARRQWSYRDLPQRYASTTKVYRDEQTGELSGLARVRAITQDDAHVFCRQDQVKAEMAKIWQIIETFYGAFGFALKPRLSLHDPTNMKAYLGTEEVWQKAESQLRELVREKGTAAIEAVGEAAFYGPKIDFLGQDSLGREWQVATIQLDMNMPERFDLTCINERGEKERIVMIHAAIMGSLERFISTLIEHSAGNFPTWLAPVQVEVLPVGEAHEAYAKTVIDKLATAGVRAELKASGETLGKRIREAKLEKIPYLLVVGEKEVADKTVTVEKRGSAAKGVSKNLDDFIQEISEEIKARRR